MSVYIRGMAQLEAKLLRLAAAANEIAGAATQSYAEDIAEDARGYTPVETGRLRDSIYSDENEVGTDVEYAPFVEYGTVNMPAQPFLRPAADTADIHTPEAAAKARAVIEAII
jgi:HK97 gp10 family phage protein